MLLKVKRTIIGQLTMNIQYINSEIHKEKRSRRLIFFLLMGALVIKGAWILYVILNAGIGLGPDEAQYWTWSQRLAFGYYSKPPAIAWQIWSGVELFGNNELGVRFAAVLIGTALPLLVYALGRSAQLSRMASFWAAMIIAWSPLGVMASFLAITDGGMVCFGPWQRYWLPNL